MVDYSHFITKNLILKMFWTQVFRHVQMASKFSLSGYNIF